MEVTLGPEDEKLLGRLQRKGAYPDPQKAVSAALRALQARQEAIERVGEKIARGQADLDRGDVVEGEEFMARFLAEIDEFENRQAG